MTGPVFTLEDIDDGHLHLVSVHTSFESAVIAADAADRGKLTDWYEIGGSYVGRSQTAADVGRMPWFGQVIDKYDIEDLT